MFKFIQMKHFSNKTEVIPLAISVQADDVNSKAQEAEDSGTESQFLCLLGVWFWLIVWTLQACFFICKMEIIILSIL